MYNSWSFHVFIKTLLESIQSWYVHECLRAVGAAKAKHVQLQSVFWLVCKEGGMIKYPFHRIPGTIWYDLIFPSCNDLQVLSSVCVASPSPYVQSKLLHFFDPKLSALDGAEDYPQLAAELCQ